MTFIFILGYPHTPQGCPQGGGVGNLEGVESYSTIKIMFYINSGIFNSGEFKNDHYLHLGYPQPLQERPRGER